MQRRRLGCRQLVRGHIAGVVEKSQGAVVGNEMLDKKGIGAAETLPKESPQAPPADLRAQTGKAFDRPRGILHCGLPHHTLDPQPVTHRGDLAKRHAALNHSEGAGIHAEKQHPPVACRVTAQVGLMRRPGVGQGVVDVAHRRREAQRRESSREQPRGGNKFRNNRRVSQFQHWPAQPQQVQANACASTRPSELREGPPLPRTNKRPASQLFRSARQLPG